MTVIPLDLDEAAWRKTLHPGIKRNLVGENPWRARAGAASLPGFQP
jgi:hypothetical protein